MRNYLYNTFKHFFIDEINDDMAPEISSAYQRGVHQGEDKSEQLIAKMVNDKYSKDNWLVDPSTVIHASESGNVFINREPITKDEIKVLKEEIKYLTRCRIWSIFQETLRQKAIEKAVMQSTNFEHVLAGKMMVHSLGIIKSIVETIQKIKD